MHGVRHSCEEHSEEIEWATKQKYPLMYTIRGARDDFFVGSAFTHILRVLQTRRGDRRVNVTVRLCIKFNQYVGPLLRRP